MSAVVISGNTSGSVTLDAPAVAGTTTYTLAAVSGTISPLVSGTAVASTSGTSIDFTGIPSWVKRITVMFSGVSVSGTSSFLVQIGAGSIATSGYSSSGTLSDSASSTTSSTAGFIIYNNVAAALFSGQMVITNITSNTWIESGSGKLSTTRCAFFGGDFSLGGTLDRLRITTVNGTDTFDAGSINIMYE